MATARKQDDGRWAVQVYVRRDIDGKQRRKRIYGRTKREAELAAAQWEVKKQHVEDPDNMTVLVSAYSGRIMKVYRGSMSEKDVNYFKDIWNE